MGQPLSNVRILDLSLIMAGPYCTLILGDLGAEVIKIERPGIGEGARGVPPHFFEGESAYFIAMNRNKQSMTLDLKTEKGKEIFYELAKRSDVVIDNFRPGVVKKLGVDFDVLNKINPKIICCSISGYGQTGPFNDRPAFDLIIQARGGVMSYTGEPGQMPVRMGAPMGDLTGGLFAAQGILAALYQREQTGRGQRIDISLLDCQISLLTYRGQYYFIGNEIAQPIGSGHTSLHPIRAFKTKTFDIVIDCNTENIFRELCDAIGRPLDKRIPIGPINTVDKVLSDPQVLSRNMVAEVDYGNGKILKILGNPIKMSEIDQEVFKAPPRLGENTEDVLKSILRYSSHEIDDLRSKKII